MKTLLALSAIIATSAFAEEMDWQPLIDKDLSQWEVFIGVPHKTVEIPDMPPFESENGTSGTPLGLGNDPLKVFTTMEEDGETVVHISGQIYGALSSKEEFENYHFSTEIKWGEKKWEPRLEVKRDSGILFHAVGEHATFWNVWMSSLECQIQEQDMGDFIALGGTSAMIRASKDTSGGQGAMTYDPAAEPARNGGYYNASVDADKPNGEWNTVELYVVGGDAVFVVNGQPNMAITEAMYKGKPLTKGKLQIQSEAAEVFYKNMRIRSIESFPEELALLVKK